MSWLRANCCITPIPTDLIMNYHILSLLVLFSLSLASCSSDTQSPRSTVSGGVTALPRDAFSVVELSGPTAAGSGAVTVPEDAVFSYAELQGVQVLAPDSILSTRWVRIGQRLPDGRIEVQSGLDAGETVLAIPQLSLQDGTIITVKQ